MSENNLLVGDKPITAPELRKLFLDYMVNHSDRKLNILFWNAANLKQRLLVFTNFDSDKLVKINNNELIFRIVRVKNKKDWNIISTFINDYILKTKFDMFSATISIKLNSLLSYLNNIDYDINKIDIKMNSYFSYSYSKENDKEVTIGNLERDYLCLYRISQMIQEYGIIETDFLVEKEVPEENIFKFNILDIVDIKELKIDDTEHIEIDFSTIDPSIKNTKTFITPGSEMMSLKMLKDLPVKTTSIYILLKKISEAFKLIIFVSTQSFDVITTRPYIDYYNLKSKGKK